MGGGCWSVFRVPPVISILWGVAHGRPPVARNESIMPFVAGLRSAGAFVDLIQLELRRLSAGAEQRPGAPRGVQERRGRPMDRHGRRRPTAQVRRHEGTDDVVVPFTMRCNDKFKPKGKADVDTQYVERASQSAMRIDQDG